MNFMYISGPPENWREVEESALEEFLSRCADYRSDSYSGHRRFSFAHNGKPFACVHGDKCFADPDLLEKGK